MVQCTVLDIKTNLFFFFTQALQCQIQNDKEVLLTFTELRKQMENVPMDCSLEVVFQRYIQGYSCVLSIMLEAAPSARNWVSMNDINQQTGNLGYSSTFSSNWHIAGESYNIIIIIINILYSQ